MPQIDAALARTDERAALANMMQLYIHDFGELWSRASPGERGRAWSFRVGLRRGGTTGEWTAALGSREAIDVSDARAGVAAHSRQ